MCSVDKNNPCDISDADSKELSDVSEIVRSTVIRFHHPGLPFRTFHCQSNGFQSITVVKAVCRVHQTVALLPIMNRIKKVGLHRSR